MAYNILIVDDSLPMRAVIKKTIRASGVSVGELFEVSNGKDALILLKKQWLDLVLVDYNMPDMNGLELIAEMKKDEFLKSIPVIMTTVEGSRQRIKEFIAKGAADYIRKPFTPEEARDKLYKVMGGAADGDAGPDTSTETLDF